MFVGCFHVIDETVKLIESEGALLVVAFYAGFYPFFMIWRGL